MPLHRSSRRAPALLVPVLAFALGGVLASALACADAAVVEPIEKVAPLVVAARDNDGAALRALLAARPAPDVNQRTADGTSALHWAVHHGQRDLVSALLAAGADANARNDYGATPMSEAAIRGDVGLLRALLAAGANAESANADGQTTLMIPLPDQQCRSRAAADQSRRQRQRARELAQSDRTHVGRRAAAAGHGSPAAQAWRRSR